MSAGAATARPAALIAEDEPLLAQALRAELAAAWPELDVAGIVGDGQSAVREALALRPDVLFFDIRMPGQDGLDAAAELADAWEDGQEGAEPFPLLVFVTAYDEYALRAFDSQAVDYVLKPVQPQRLAKTVARLKEALAARRPGDGSFEKTMDQLREILRVAQDDKRGVPGNSDVILSGREGSASAPLTVLQCGVGNTIRMVPVADVVYLEAADKYVRVLTAESEFLLRTPLKDLLPRLDADAFWQIHRGTVVRATAIESVTRDDQGRLHLALRGRPEKLAVSRLHAQRFRAL